MCVSADKNLNGSFITCVLVSSLAVKLLTSLVARLLIRWEFTHSHRESLSVVYSLLVWLRMEFIKNYAPPPLSQRGSLLLLLSAFALLIGNSREQVLHTCLPHSDTNWSFSRDEPVTERTERTDTHTHTALVLAVFLIVVATAHVHEKSAIRISLFLFVLLFRNSRHFPSIEQMCVCVCPSESTTQIHNR